jgi:hypothetical protein
MATELVQEFKNVDYYRSTTNYDHVIDRLSLDSEPPDGLIVHTAGWDEKAGVFRIVAVWQSADAASAFMRDRLQPVLDEGPVNPVRREEPDLESMYDAHHIVKGRCRGEQDLEFRSRSV